MMAVDFAPAHRLRGSTNEAVGFVRHMLAVAWKDLRVELRTREILSTMVFFAATIVLVCSFAFVEKVQSPSDMASGVLWIAVAFSGNLGLSRAFERERDGNTMRALLLSPAPRGAILLGKALGVASNVIIVEAVVVVMVAVLFGAPAASAPLPLALLLVLGALGFAMVGSVFAGMLLRSRSREVLLPIALFPVLMPLLIAGVNGTSALWRPEPMMNHVWFWIELLVVIDLLFLLVSLWAFESLVVE
jgi:heme exporter protein CcmB